MFFISVYSLPSVLGYSTVYLHTYAHGLLPFTDLLYGYTFVYIFTLVLFLIFSVSFHLNIDVYILLSILYDIYSHMLHGLIFYISFFCFTLQISCLYYWHYSYNRLKSKRGLNPIFSFTPKPLGPPIYLKVGVLIPSRWNKYFLSFSQLITKISAQDKTK